MKVCGMPINEFINALLRRKWVSPDLSDKDIQIETFLKEIVSAGTTVRSEDSIVFEGKHKTHAKGKTVLTKASQVRVQAQQHIRNLLKSGILSGPEISPTLFLTKCPPEVIETPAFQSYYLRLPKKEGTKCSFREFVHGKQTLFAIPRSSSRKPRQKYYVPMLDEERKQREKKQEQAREKNREIRHHCITKPYRTSPKM